MAASSHAVLSASAAYRWMNCTPSAIYTKDIPDKPSPFSEEGTKAHALAEERLRHFISTGQDLIKPDEQSDADRDMWTNVSIYVKNCIDLFNQRKQISEDTLMFIEQKIDFSNWVPGGFGTADCVIISGDELFVRDLKYGKGVPVSALNNPQARCYGLGALNAFGDLYEINTIHNQIDQVRLDGGQSEEVLSTEDLLKWAEETLSPAAKLAAEGKGEFKPGAWCRFCKAGATCPKRAETGTALITQAQTSHDLTQLTDEQISMILTVKSDVEKWMDSIEHYAIERAQEGNPIPGWKLVEGRSVRQWTDDLEVQNRLRQNGYKDAEFTERKMYSITKMTALLGGKKAFESLLGDLVVKPAGKPVLVPESDSREEIKQHNAIADFSEEKEK